MSRGSVFETLAGALLWSGFLFGWAVLPAQAVTIDWVSVGNPGNPADTTVMSDGASGYGSVPYAYRIGKYDVTNSQYAEFLNAKDPSGTNRLGLYNTNMSDAMFGGISFTVGAANGSKYNVVAGRGNHPVNYVSWYSTQFASPIGSTTARGAAIRRRGPTLLQAARPRRATPTRSRGNPERRCFFPAKTSGTRRPTITLAPIRIIATQLRATPNRRRAARRKHRTMRIFRAGRKN